MKTIEKILNWFKKSKEEFQQPGEVIVNPPKEIPIIKIEDDKKDYGKRIEECTLCKTPIETFHKRRHFGNGYYHKRCYKTTIGLVKSELHV